MSVSHLSIKTPVGQLGHPTTDKEPGSLSIALEATVWQILPSQMSLKLPWGQGSLAGPILVSQMEILWLVIAGPGDAIGAGGYNKAQFAAPTAAAVAAGGGY